MLPTPKNMKCTVRPDVEIVFSQQQTTSADILNVERRQQKLGEFESMASIIRRIAFASLLATCIAAIKNDEMYSYN